MTYYRLFNIIDSQLRQGKTLKSCAQFLYNQPFRDPFFRINYVKWFLDSPKYIQNQYGYKRIPIYKSSLLEMHLLEWNLKSESPIHKHPELGCLMKIISGQLEEKQFRHTDRSHLNQPSLTNVEINILKKGDVHYIPGGDVSHKIKNHCINAKSVSLHLYAPPYHVEELG